MHRKQLNDLDLFPFGEHKGKPQTAEQIATAISADPEEVFHIGRHLAANHSDVSHSVGPKSSDDTFTLK